VDEKPLISKEALKLAEHLKTNYVEPLFSYLNLMIPSPLKKPLKRKVLLKDSKNKPLKKRSEPKDLPNQDLKELEKALLSPQDILITGHYHFGIEEALFHLLSKRNHQKVLILTPDILFAESLYEAIIEFVPEANLYHSKRKTSEKRKTIDFISNHPGILIGTKTALFIHPESWDYIVVMHAESPFYRHLERPRYDTLEVCDYLSKHGQSRIIYIASTPPLNLLKKVIDETITEVKLEVSTQPFFNPIIIPMHSHHLKQASLIHPKTLKLIDQLIRLNKKIIIIHERKETTEYDEKTLVFGLETLLEELAIYKLHVITSETMQPLRVLKEFKEEGQILMGTSVLLNLNHIEKVGAVILIKWDDFLNDVTEGHLNGFITLKKASQKLSTDPAHLVIQTYHENHSVLKTFIEKKEDFMIEELERAKSLSLPPYVDMVQIILTSDQSRQRDFYAKSALKYLEKALRNHAQIYGPRVQNQHAIITVKADDLSPYRKSLRSLIQAFHEDINIELRNNHFII
jgi:primosomal protein N'